MSRKIILSAPVLFCLAGILARTCDATSFVVTTNADSGPGSLRQALISSNTNGVPDDITFNIGGTPPFTITLLSSLPGLAAPDTWVRADTQPGTLVGSPAIYLKPVAGNAAQTSSVFASSTSGCRVRGFHISGFTNVTAISLFGYGTNVIAGNIIFNNGDGVYIGGGQNNVIGGLSVSERNVISSNTDVGVRIEGGSNNLVVGNFIGTSTNGLVAWPNRLSGVFVENSTGNTIEGTPAVAQVISGNGSAGIALATTNTRGTLIIGNFIGTDLTGTQKLANTISGITLDGTVGVTIGGTNAGERNVVSGNSEWGIFLTHGSVSNDIIGNLIGIGSNAVSIVSNRFDGVRIFDSRRNTVGPGNVIGGNEGAGVLIDGTGSVANAIQANLIGLNAANARIGNSYGVRIDGAVSNLIGIASSDGNVISGNRSHGVWLNNGADHTYLGGNLIGVNTSATAAVSNNSYGIRITDSDNTHLGLALFAYNVIAGNGSGGIVIDGTSSNTMIRGAFIGIGASYTNKIPNGGAGIWSVGPSTRVGEASVFVGDYIAGNDGDGIFLDSGADDSVVLNTSVGIYLNGATISNGQYGIRINNAKRVRIGDGTADGNNRILASRLSGIIVYGSASNTVILGNVIGIESSGTNAVRNGVGGIDVSADYTTIGGTNALDGNLIGGHQGAYGIQVTAGQHVRIVGNTIGLATNGVMPVPNGYGIHLLGNARGVVVGGTNANERNVIARNDYEEIMIDGPSGENVIQGNFIGVRDSGLAFGSLNSEAALRAFNSASNWILGNVVGQTYEGIMLEGTGTVANVVQGNFVGEYNAEAIGHLLWGVHIRNASSNFIGGTKLSERNVVAQNGGGIIVTNSVGTNALGNLLAVNLVYSNGPMPNIDLGGDGPTPNDALDADSGANNLQNKPTLTNGFIAGGLVYAQGVLTSQAARTYAVDIYRNPDGANAGGRIYLGRVPVTTDGSGVGAFTAGFIINLSTTVFLSATATDPDNNTSEFSRGPTNLVGVTGDSDLDLIPNFWETLYGFNPAVSNPPGSDADTDGYSDLSEYIADTAANDSNSYPCITAISNQVASKVTFPSSGARAYLLYYNDDLVANPAWAQSGTTVTGAYGFTTMADASSGTNRAYRVSVKLP